MKKELVLLLTCGVILSFILLASAWTPLQVIDDYLVRMPGTQPNQVSLEAPGRCLNCHAGYDSALEPGFNWKGSMMAHSARDFLFWSCLTVAAQDSIWAVGTPNATDICERCHFPKGWLEGRSDPTNGSAMTGADYDGVQCDFCHRMYDPFFEETHSGFREGDDWTGYWDETNASSTPSASAAETTYGEDVNQASTIEKFNLSPFFDNNNQPPAGYTENGSGQYFVSSSAEKRASFADADARHRMLYSRHHKSKYFCNACHDVSNPILANLLGSANDGSDLFTETHSASSFFHVERTFSEFMLSAYGSQGGASTNPGFQSQGAPDITHAGKCQDCHMRDMVGVACNKTGAPVRPDQSIEHPQSGQPLHDMTGGNAWVSYVLASSVPGSPNYDATNDSLLNQGAGTLTLDPAQGEGIDPAALLAGVDRAKQQLLLAATIQNLNYVPATGALSFEIQNNSGHKLISGFPEGRRMFVNIRAYYGGVLIYEVNPYDYNAGTLKGLDYPYISSMGMSDPQLLGSTEIYEDTLVYEMEPGSPDLTGETKTFHFALATGRYKDNRIPPKGFDIDNAAARLSKPVWHGVEDAGYYTGAEYAGGYDAVSLSIPTGADYVEVSLYYQTTSREYIEFLRNEITGAGNPTLSSPTPSGEPEAYIIQTDSFFSQLKAWGNTLWDLWVHNRNVDGAAPILMAQAAIGGSTGCSLNGPSGLTATSGHTQVSLNWTAVTGATGYRVYYDQSGKAQFLADTGGNTSYRDTGLTDGVEYCYMVTSYDTTCESSFSTVICATPTNQGQAGPFVGVSSMETGIYSGKGNNKTFAQQDTFNAGDTVTVRALVLDASGAPVSNATVEIVIGGPETVTLNSNPSGIDGWAEASWQTKASGKRNPGTSAGTYKATTANVTASGYNWDSVTTQVTFTVQ